MSNGKFSQPRFSRDEEREIEQAFRQVTGQDPLPELPAEDTVRLNDDTVLLDEKELDRLLELDLPAEELPPVIPESHVSATVDPEPPVVIPAADPAPIPAEPQPESEPLDFGMKVMILLEQAIADLPE